MNFQFHRKTQIKMKLVECEKKRGNKTMEIPLQFKCFAQVATIYILNK